MPTAAAADSARHSGRASHAFRCIGAAGAAAASPPSQRFIYPASRYALHSRYRTTPAGTLERNFS